MNPPLLSPDNLVQPLSGEDATRSHSAAIASRLSDPSGQSTPGPATRIPRGGCEVSVIIQAFVVLTGGEARLGSITPNGQKASLFQLGDQRWLSLEVLAMPCFGGLEVGVNARW